MPNAFDSYIAKQCGYALHLDFLPEGVRPAPIAGEPIDELRARNRTKFRSDIGSILAGNYPDIVRIGYDNSAADQTTEAMNSGARLIWNAHLPQDVVNQRAGRPNLLVRFGDAPQDGTWRYVPVTVQTHKTHNKQVSGRNSLILGSLNSLVINEGEVVNAAPRERKDVIKLSHYWSMLETLDRAPQGMAPTGGIVGRVDLQPELIWVSFDLDDYQDKFNQALAIIHHSETVTTSPLIDTSARSYRHADCTSCRWKMVCKEQWEVRDDLGLAAVDREATRLKAEGLTTRTELAKLNLDATPPNKDDRMNAILKARAQIGNRAVIRPTANIAANLIPSADIEIDVDMENTEDHCYIWGTYTTIHGDSAPEGLTQGYRPFAVFESDGQTFAQANAENEAKAFANFWQWAQHLISECEQLGVSIGFYFYTEAENTWLRAGARRYAGEPGIPSLDDIESFIDSPLWIDIAPKASAIWATATGEDLGSIAELLGHTWESEEDGGESSQVWFDEATHSSDPSTRLRRSKQLLTYNENDVVATKVIREYLKSNWPFDEVEPPTLP